MRKPDADKLFISTYYGSDEAFMKAVQDDYCAAQLAWSYFIDSLCKSGEITLGQYESWGFPGNKYRRTA